MASLIDATKPADGVGSVKADLRANLLAAKNEIEALQAGGGGGVTDAQDLNYTLPATGAVQRNAEQRLADIRSVKDFGAVGDIYTDDTAAIQAAVNTGETIYFPAGVYQITAPITFPNRLSLVGCSSHIQGGNANISFIFQNTFGSSPAPMFHRAGGYIDNTNTFIGSTTNWAGTGGCVNLRHLVFSANSTYGCILQTGSTQRPIIFDCHFDSNYRGVIINAAFGGNVIGCKFNGHCSGSGRLLVDSLDRIMLNVPGHTIVSGCDFQGCDTAILATGSENNIYACRIEVCAYAVRFGGQSFAHDNLAEANMPFQASTCSGLSLESNWRALTVHAMTDASSITNCNGYGLGGGFWTDPPWTSGGGPSQGLSDYGLKINSNFAHPCVIDNVQLTGSYIDAAIINESRYYAPSRFNAANGTSGRPLVRGLSQTFSSRVNAPVAKISVIDALFNPDKNNALSEDRRVLVYFHSQHLRGLNGLNIRDTNVLANNLGGIETPATSATTHAVTFVTQKALGDAAFGSVPAAGGSGNTLPAGTYWYGTSIIGQRGESGFNKTGLSGAYQSVVVTSGQKVDMTFNGYTDAAKMKRRIYRGSVLGYFSGYWEQAGDNYAFSDTGQAFDGCDSPPDANGVVPSNAEIDANYGIMVTPSWLTTFRVTSKATTGFTIDFGTAVPSGGTVQWLLFRP